MNKQLNFFLLSILSANVFSGEGVEVDKFARLVSYPNKIEVACPNQTNKTGVLLAIGQSNSANHGEKLFSTKYPAKVLNYFNGKCYIASSPLLGASATAGEFITPLADKLIDNGDYDTVIIISSGIGATQIKRWEKGGDLNSMLLNVLGDAKIKYHVTEIIWQQGETDFSLKTAAKDYVKSFYSLLDSIRSPGSKNPPIYYAVSTRCGNEWSAANPTAEAQNVLANDGMNIYLVANTDQLVPEEERIDYNCHFKENAQLKVAESYAASIHQHKQTSKKD